MNGIDAAGQLGGGCRFDDPDGLSSHAEVASYDPFLSFADLFAFVQ